MTLENFRIYHLAEKLEIQIFKETKSFPADEKYRSIDQLRRSSSATTNNIVEGYSRYSYQEKIRYFIIARAEAEETKRGISRAAKKDFISNQLSVNVCNEYTILIKSINKYISFLRKKINVTQFT